MGWLNRVSLALFLLSLSTLSACQELTLRDPQRLFKPSVELSEVVAF